MLFLADCKVKVEFSVACCRTNAMVHKYIGCTKKLLYKIVLKHF